MKHEIRSTNHEHNMAAWCSEKSEHVLANLAWAVDRLKQQEGLESPDSALGYLHHCIWDATKLLAFSTGAEWSTNDPILVREEGYDGFEKLLVRYGVLEATASEKQRKRQEILVQSIISLLDGPRTNRTLIHERLAAYRGDSTALKTLSDLLEKVTNGELEWNAFVSKAKPLLSEV